MKKKIILSLFIILSLCFITGCGTDKNTKASVLKELVGTWEYKNETDSPYIKGIAAYYTFDEDYNFYYKSVTIMNNGQEMTLKDLDGKFEIDNENNKIKLNFNDKDESDGVVNEIEYINSGSKFIFNPDKDGNAVYSKK